MGDFQVRFSLAGFSGGWGGGGGVSLFVVKRRDLYLLFFCKKEKVKYSLVLRTKIGYKGEGQRP